MPAFPGGFAGLQKVDLSNSGCQRVPPVLSAATQLSSLVFDCCCAVRLSRANVQALLHLPLLERLCLASHSRNDAGQDLPPPAQRSALARLQRERPGMEVRWWMCCCGAWDSEPEAA